MVMIQITEKLGCDKRKSGVLVIFVEVMGNSLHSIQPGLISSALGIHDLHWTPFFLVLVS